MESHRLLGKVKESSGDRYLRPLLCIALIGLYSGLAAAQLAVPATMVDPQSGVAFPVTLRPPGGIDSQQLTGTATRERSIFRVKVYAYGLYVDADAARKELTMFLGRPAGAFDRPFFQRLLDMRIPMTLRLVMTRDIAGDAIGNAFDDALKPRVAKASKELNRTDGATALERFRSYFNLREVARGTEFVFSCSPGGRLNTTVNTQSMPEIQSAALCWALFDIYLGNNPVSTEGRRSLITGFPALLAGSR
jgi:hypothetical protein